MPTRPGKACRINSCAEIVKDHSNAGYCTTHKGMSGWRGNEKVNGDRHKRGYGTQWTKLRSLVLIRDKHLCQDCLSRGVANTGTHCDHITPKSKGGSDTPSNLQILCESCHRTKTAKE